MFVILSHTTMKILLYRNKFNKFINIWAWMLMRGEMIQIPQTRAIKVSHFSYTPPFQGPHFWRKCWIQTFYVIIYLLTFYLFDEIKKNI